MVNLHILSGGAAQGVVRALQCGFERQAPCRLICTFNAVGALRDRLREGAPADVLILTRQMIGALQRDGDVVVGTAADLGGVETAIAVRDGDPLPDVGHATALRSALRAAEAIYLPDPERATAGIHFAKVLQRLGVADELVGRLKPFPNGATAMAALAAHTIGLPIGCTQVTEILGTPGAAVVGPLPHPFELATVYTAAVATRSTAPALAERLVGALTDSQAAELRTRAGFTPAR